MKGKHLILGVFAIALALMLIVSVGSVASAAAPALNPVCPQAAMPGPLLQGGELPLKLFMPYTVQPCTGLAIEVPFLDRWATSPHNDHDAEAFRHWDAEGEIPANCAKCHSTPGFEEFLFTDTIAEAIPVGSTVECVACHNDVTLYKTSVTFPSGVTIDDLGPQSVCMECHQGRESGPSVQAKIDGKNLPDDDTVDATLSFSNIHYFAAAATRLGSEVHGGYEYDGEDYDQRFTHVEEYDECNECHDMHTLELKVNECVACHGEGEVLDYRMNGSLQDYDGDGDITEGIYYEITGMQEKLYAAIQAYAVEVSGTPIVYDENTYPYWIDGAVGGSYKAFTGRLLKAAYNYHLTVKDPGQFTHNAKYIIQLLHDSTADLNTKIAAPVDLSMAARNDVPHFDGTTGGHNSANCNRCHNPAGLPLIVANPSTVVMSAGNTTHLSINQPGSATSQDCSTCHAALGPDWTLSSLEEVQFPGGPMSSFGAGDEASNLCIACHQGRESGAAVDFEIGDTADDAQVPGQTAGGIRVHYAVAGATLFGTDAKGMSEYEGKTYKGALVHVGNRNSCNECHGEHSLDLPVNNCAGCHGAPTSVDDLRNINMSNTDWDHNGTVQGVKYEIDGVAELLYTALKAYAQNTVGTCIVINGSRFAIDTNCNGELDGDEGATANRYNMFTPKLMRAAYNYAYVAYSSNDSGAYTHNPKYVIQVLYDGLESFGHDMTGFPARP